MPNRWFSVAVVLVLPGVSLAAPERLIEEIIVTAQRIEQDASKVPMSVSAFTDTMIDDRQIVAVSDLQINVPNLTYSQQNFGGGRVAVRGVGDAVNSERRQVAAPSVPIHINGISAAVDISVMEFYDLERIEVLRGPQGTLYGRNATAGAMNFVTRRPDFTGHGGYVDVEYGDYDHTRVKGAVNLALNDQFAFRAAGLVLERDGYIENKAAEDIPGIDDNLDGRDLHAFRLTGEWRPSNGLSLWLMYSRFDEDDTKVRIANQVCKQSTLPNLGCDPNTFGLEPVHPASGLGPVFATYAGALDVNNLTYEFPRPPLGLREQHTDLNPSFQFEEDAWLLGADWQLDSLTLSFGASYFDTSIASLQDYFMDVSAVLNPTTQNPSGLWPTSASAGLGSFRSGPCNVETGNAGVFGPCTFNSDLNRMFTYDRTAEDIEFSGAEVRARSQRDGRVNFLVGANYLAIDIASQYEVFANTLDLIGLYGAPGAGIPQLYPTMFNNFNDRRIESYSAFGELYVDLSERLRLTLGLRYSYDEQERDTAAALFNSFNVAPFLPPGTVEDPAWVRGELGGYFSGTPDATAVALADYYGATDAIAAATNAAELVAALQLVPPAPRPGENLGLGVGPTAGLARREDWDDVSGRVGIDWSATDNLMLYGFFTQGYRPGGFTQIGTYDSERVNAFELGGKTLLAGGSLRLDGAVFSNHYDDMQIWEVRNGATFQKNVDAESKGLEIEATWRPPVLPNLALDVGYAWLDTEITSGQSIDVMNRTSGDPALVNLKDFSALGYTAPVADVLPLVDAAIDSFAALPAFGAYANGIPVYFDPGFLTGAGVTVSEGRPASLDGNELPNSPTHSLRLGGAYTWVFAPGSVTMRYDYYWQDASYGREFNTRGDEIDSWEQHNASVVFESAGGRWSARAWIRNITDEDIVTGHYVAPDNSGNFRNYFMAEPRIYGASLRYNFGAL